jgi:hypothetical protein
VSDQRIWPNQNPFDPTQNGRVGANPQRQAKDSQYGKARTAPKHSEAEAKVLQKRFHLVVRWAASQCDYTNRRERRQFAELAQSEL